MNPADHINRRRLVDARVAVDDELDAIVLEDVHDARRWSLSRAECYDLSQGVAARVLSTAVGSPSAIAVVDDRCSLTYGQLARAFLAVAARMEEEGIGAGEVVGVACRRGADAIIGLLATQYLAAVYLPVSDDWPLKRGVRVLAESGARVVLTSESGPVFAEAAIPLRYIVIRSDPGDSGMALELDSHKERGTPSSLAYVIYTSGSTGLPKGAVVQRCGMMNHLACKLQDLRLSNSDVVAQTASLAFDISIWQMLAPLLVGAQVHVLEDATANSPSAILEAVKHRHVTVLELVPSVLRVLLEECQRVGPSSSLSGLRWMLVTGEALSPGLARWWRHLQPGVPLLNAYGPTECSDDVTHHIVSTVEEKSVCVPIGGPVANTALYVLSQSGDSWRACPPGEIGELFVGGIGVGLGYIGDLERTRHVFFRDTLSGRGRLYRTGDLVRLRPGGVLEYRGRVDRQVKIRGVRIELDEIEAVLSEHPAIGACAVVMREADSRRLVARDVGGQMDGSASRRMLVAYLCPKAPVNTPELRTFLSERISVKVIPDRYVVLVSLPLTPNGKTDYLALPSPDAVRPDVSMCYEPPANDLEHLVTSVWAEALQIDRVGRHDKFLELGGDSLVAMQVAAQLRQQTGIALSFRELLLSQTPASLAEIIQQTSATSNVVSGDGDAGTREQAPSGPMVRWPLSTYQEGIYFQWCLAPESPYYTYQGVLQMVGPVDFLRLTSAWNALLAENPALLSRFHEEDGKPFQVPGAWQCLLNEPIDMREILVEERDNTFRTFAYEQARIPFDLASQPALRASLIRFADDEYRVVVTMHEILLDGWGAMVLFSRLAELYNHPSGRSEFKGADFRNYLRWESEHLQRPHISDAARYWSDELSGMRRPLDLPTDRPRPSIPSYRGRLVQHVLSERELHALDTSCRSAGATQFMVLLAAFGIVLAYYGNAQEVTIGVPMSNRDSPEQIKVVAFLLNMLPMRLSPRHDSTCANYLEEVRDKVIRSFAVSDYPFSWMLREFTTMSREINRTPVFQVMLNVLNYPKRRVVSSDVTFEFIELESGFTKYECSLYAQPHGAHSLVLQIAYQTDLFDESTASRFLESVAHAICRLGENPDAQLGQLDLVPVADSIMFDHLSIYT